MSLFEKLFVAIDGAIFIGGGIVHFQERKECELGNREKSCGSMDNPAAERESQIGGTFTAGLNFMAYINQWIAVNLEFRATPFRWNAGGTDESGQAAALWNLRNATNDFTGDEYWEYSSSGEGDYPDGKINKDDRSWNANMTIGLGVSVYLPTTASIGD